DPVVSAAVNSYMTRIVNRVVDSVAADLDNDRVRVTGFSRVSEGAATTGVLVALLLPAVQAAREAARRNNTMHDLEQVGQAIINYHRANNQFPPQAIQHERGRALLSWRVALLPYLGEAELYKQFHLDEPWDSAHNKQLIAQMPGVFQDLHLPG